MGSPEFKNEFPITLITGAKKCIKKPPNTLLNPSKVSHASILLLFISPGPKNMLESRRVSQGGANHQPNDYSVVTKLHFSNLRGGRSLIIVWFLTIYHLLSLKKRILAKKFKKIYTSPHLGLNLAKT